MVRGLAVFQTGDGYSPAETSRRRRRHRSVHPPGSGDRARPPNSTSGAFVLPVHVAHSPGQAQGVHLAEQEYHVLQPGQSRVAFQVIRYNNDCVLRLFAETLSLYQLCGVGLASSCRSRVGTHHKAGADHQFVPKEYQKGSYKSMWMWWLSLWL
jgi:hypothetical protein